MISFQKIAIIAIIALAGCSSTQVVTWPTSTTEAFIKLPQEARKIALLNQVRLAYPNTTNPSAINPNSGEALNSSLSGFRKQVTDQRHLTIFSNLTEYTMNANGNFAPLLTIEMVKQLGMGSDVLVSLAMLDQKISDTYTVEIRRESLGNNVYREVDYFIGKRSINIQFGWRVYDVKTGTLIDEYTQKEAYFYEAVSKVRQQATAILNNNFVTELTNLGYKYGAQYAARISPTTLRAHREIYDTGSDALKQGAISAKAENWDEASKIWQSAVIQEKKAKSKAKLYHNLAINEERQGNMTRAREYARLAAVLHPLGVKTQSLVAY